MEGGRWKVDFLHVKETNLGKKNKANIGRIEEREDGWQKKKKMKEKRLFFSARVYPPLGYFPSSSFFSFSSVVVVVVVVGLEANSFLVPRSKRREAVIYKHQHTSLALSLSLSLRGP